MNWRKTMAELCLRGTDVVILDQVRFGIL